jgi:hypothetical protein
VVVVVVVAEAVPYFISVFLSSFLPLLVEAALEGGEATLWGGFSAHPRHSSPPSLLLVFGL